MCEVDRVRDYLRVYGGQSVPANMPLHGEAGLQHWTMPTRPARWIANRTHTYDIDFWAAQPQQQQQRRPQKQQQPKHQPATHRETTRKQCRITAAGARPAPVRQRPGCRSHCHRCTAASYLLTTPTRTERERQRDREKGDTRARPDRKTPKQQWRPRIADGRTCRSTRLVTRLLLLFVPALAEQGLISALTSQSLQNS